MQVRIGSQQPGKEGSRLTLGVSVGSLSGKGDYSLILCFLLGEGLLDPLWAMAQRISTAHFCRCLDEL